MPKPLSSLHDGDEFDIVVLGAGGAGMSAALFAAIDGGPQARVLLVESTSQVGGTTAWSAATTWIPGTHLAPQVNKDDTLERATTFLDAAVGDRSPRAVREALLAHGGEAVAKIEKHSQVKYRIRPFHPDYLSELEGSTLCGRALEPLPFDGRLLGADFDLVRAPMPEFMVLGGMMVDRDDIPHMLGWHKSWKSFHYATRVILRHLRDRLTRDRGTRLLMGNALVGRLLLSLRERGVMLLTETRAVALHRAGGATSGPVTEITLRQGETQRRLRVKGGVVLASGGFNRHPTRRAERLPGIPPEWCPGAPGHTGQAHELAEAIGAVYGKTGMSDCFWAPVSLRQRKDGSTAAFPHFVFDRAKPHMVTVDSEGERFLNESTSYHLFGLAMQAANQRRPSIPAFLITDAQGMHKYGLGMVRPRGMGLPDALGDGYVTSAATLAELAGKLGLPADKLQATVARLNAYAAEGTDPEFGRGTTAYQRANGDATWTGRNPSLGPIEKAPFYAVRLYPGDIGAATGFATDPQARVLDAAGRVIDGLYAVGNDMHSAMGGVYPAPGITVGPGLVFASLAAASAVQRARGAVGAVGATEPQRLAA
jgi:succinate dehydrogenase/fumarate reductase flavoprotein subunit